MNRLVYCDRMMQTPLAVFPHVPKCGGTTIRRLLERSGLRCRFDYDRRPSSDEHWAAQCSEADRQARSSTFENLDVIFGHFPAQRYSHTGGRLIGFLRHPVDRAYSHFLYYRDMVPEQNVALSREPHLIRSVRRAEIGFLDFCQSPFIQSLYREHYFESVSPSDFAYLGFFDTFDQSLQALAQTLGFEVDRRVHGRVNTNRVALPVEVRNRAEQILYRETVWFNSMRAR